MKLIVAAVGRLKAGPEHELFDRYIKRIGPSGRALGFGPIDVLETLEGRAASAPLRRADEALRLRKLVSGCDVTVALDEAGRPFTSRDFARLVADQRDRGLQSCGFLIGGADGHGEAVLANANVKLSLGPMTLPHGLARIILAEQLYRATTILSGHPYHRD